MCATALGCDKGGSAAAPAAKSASGVAVVDVEKVARAMRWNESIEKDLRSADAEFKAQLEARTRALAQAVQERKRQIAQAAQLKPEQIDALLAAKDVRELEKLPLAPQQKDEIVRATALANQEIQSAQVGA